jgi:hypothetical protein
MVDIFLMVTRYISLGFILIFYYFFSKVPMWHTSMNVPLFVPFPLANPAVGSKFIPWHFGCSILALAFFCWNLLCKMCCLHT